MNKLKVCCIIVTYNAMKWIENCINSISEESVDLDIVIVDNHSTDKTLDFIRENYPDITILSQNHNLGFSGANNIGYELAKSNKSDYIYLLNQDTISYPNSISNLIEIYQKDSTIGVVSPIHLNNDGTSLDKKFEEYISAGSCPNYISDLTLGKTKKFYKIGFVNAAAWLVKVDVVEKMGGLFSSAFYHYGEDSNFLSRLSYHKLKCVIVPQVYVHHLREEREGKMSQKFENRKLSIKKVEIMTNINKSYSSGIKMLYKYAGQQIFKGNLRGGIELFLYPLIFRNKIIKYRNSYKSKAII